MRGRWVKCVLTTNQSQGQFPDAVPRSRKRCAWGLSFNKKGVVWQAEPTFITDCECHHFRNGWNGRSTFGCVPGAVLAGMREQRPWSKQAAPPVLSTGTSPSLHKICPFPFFIFLSPFSPDDSRRPAMTLFLVGGNQTQILLFFQVDKVSRRYRQKDDSRPFRSSLPACLPFFDVLFTRQSKK
jgi:hypothetical protein